MKIIEVDNNSFKDEINNNTLILADFNADWCGPCRMLKPILEEIDNNIKVLSVNVDNNTLLAKNYGILSIPCLILFKDGKEIKRNVGLLSQDEVIKFIGDINV